MITDLVESGCDVNAEKACVSLDYLAYHDYYSNFTSYDQYGDNNFTTFDQYGDYNFTSYDQYGDFNFTSFDHYGDFNFTSFNHYGDYNFTSYDQYDDYNFTSYEDYNFTSYDYYRGCEMDPLLHMAVGMNSTHFLRALKKVYLNTYVVPKPKYQLPSCYSLCLSIYGY